LVKGFLLQVPGVLKSDDFVFFYNSVINLVHGGKWILIHLEVIWIIPTLEKFVWILIQINILK